MVKSFVAGSTLSADICPTLRNDAVDRRGHAGRGAHAAAGSHACRASDGGDAQQLELRSRTLDGGGLRRVLCVNLLQLLPARGANLDELLGPLQLAVMRVEHRLCGHVPRLCLGERRAVDLRQGLAATNPVAERRPDLRDTPGHERGHHDLAIGVRLDDTRQPNLRGCRSTRDRRHDDPGAFHRVRAELHDDVGERRAACARGRSWRRLGARGRRHVRSVPARPEIASHQEVRGPGSGGQQSDGDQRCGALVHRHACVARHRFSPSARLSAVRASYAARKASV